MFVLKYLFQDVNGLKIYNMIFLNRFVNLLDIKLLEL